MRVTNNVVAIVQARMGSTRLPGKTLERIGNSTCLELLLQRLQRANLLDRIVVATTLHEEDAKICDVVSKHRIACYRGPDRDVLKRYLMAARNSGATSIVRITADCPLVDPELVDEAIAVHLDTRSEVTFNYVPPTYPDGLDVAVISRSSLERLEQLDLSAFDREHVLTAVENDMKSWKVARLECDEDLSHHRWTLDNPEDLDYLRSLDAASRGSLHALGYRDVVDLIEADPVLSRTTAKYPRNYGHGL